MNWEKKGKLTWQLYMLDGPLGSIMHPTGSTRYMAPLDT